jgi:hypothetical protein
LFSQLPFQPVEEPAQFRPSHVTSQLILSPSPPNRYPLIPYICIPPQFKAPDQKISSGKGMQCAVLRIPLAAFNWSIHLHFSPGAFPDAIQPYGKNRGKFSVFTGVLMIQDRETILQLLHDHREALAQMGVRSLALFGSAVRDELQPNSDIDLLAELVPLILSTAMCASNFTWKIYWDVLLTWLCPRL